MLGRKLGMGVGGVLFFFIVGVECDRCGTRRDDSVTNIRQLAYVDVLDVFSTTHTRVVGHTTVPKIEAWLWGERGYVFCSILPFMLIAHRAALECQVFFA